MPEKTRDLTSEILAQSYLDDNVVRSGFGGFDTFRRKLNGPDGVEVVNTIFSIRPNGYQGHIMLGRTNVSRALARDGQDFNYVELNSSEILQALIDVFEQFLKLPPDAQELYAQQLTAWIAGNGQRPTLGE